MRHAGLENVAYCDTDGLLVNSEGSHRLDAAGLPGLRPKQRYRRIEVLGPRQLVIEGRLKAAGIPSRAVRVGDQTWRGEVWRSLPVALGAGETDTVVIASRTWDVAGVDHRRAHLPGGLTEALRAD